MAPFWREFSNGIHKFKCRSQMEPKSTNVVLRWSPKVQVSFSNGTQKFKCRSQMEPKGSSVVLKWNPKVQVSFSNGTQKFKCRSQMGPQSSSVVLKHNPKIQVSFSNATPKFKCRSQNQKKSILLLAPRAFCSWVQEHFVPGPTSILLLSPGALCSWSQEHLVAPLASAMIPVAPRPRHLAAGILRRCHPGPLIYTYARYGMGPQPRNLAAGILRQESCGAATQAPLYTPTRATGLVLRGSHYVIYSQTGRRCCEDYTTAHAV